MVKLAIIQMVLQVLDGVLTYWGMVRFGTELEANPFIGYLMELLGVAPALILCKGIVLVVLVNIIKNSEEFDCAFMRNMLIVINLLYLIVAVLPWALVHARPGILGLAKFFLTI